jgi:hypothetical protein
MNKPRAIGEQQKQQSRPSTCNRNCFATSAQLLSIEAQLSCRICVAYIQSPTYPMSTRSMIATESLLRCCSNDVPRYNPACQTLWCARLFTRKRHSNLLQLPPSALLQCLSIRVAGMLKVDLGSHKGDLPTRPQLYAILLVF